MRRTVYADVIVYMFISTDDVLVDEILIDASNRIRELLRFLFEFDK